MEIGGGYCAFLDADDFWRTDIITNDLIAQISFKNADLVAFGSISCDESGLYCDNPVLYAAGDFDGGEEVIWNFKSHFGSILYRKGLIECNGIRFMMGLKYSEDKMFLQRAAALSKAGCYMNNVLYVYRKNRTSAMGKTTAMSALEYYMPIINGWIENDDEINRSSRYNGSYSAGHTLAGIYFGDMIAEHCMQHRRISDILAVCRRHPKWDLFLDMKRENVNERQYKEHDLLISHPRIFSIKYNLIGFVTRFLRKVAYMEPFYKFYRRVRFPYILSDLKS